MAQTSFGWRGTVNELQWAQLGGLMGQGSGLATPSDCRVTQVAGTRAVSVAAGSVFGHGVLTTLSSAETVALPTPTNGQWFLLVLNRVWSSKTSSLQLRNGPTTATAVSGLVPTSYPATFASGVGSNADVPLAWLWGNSSGTAVTIVPLIRAPHSVAPRRGTTTERDALYGTPTGIAAQMQLDGAEWYDTALKSLTRYVAPFDATYNPKAPTVAAWFPMDRGVLRAKASRNASQDVGSQNAPRSVVGLNTLDAAYTRGGTFVIDTGGIRVPVAGEITLRARIVWGGPSSSGFRLASIMVNGVEVRGIVDLRPLVTGAATIVTVFERIPVVANDVVAIAVAQNSGGIVAVDAGCDLTIWYESAA